MKPLLYPLVEALLPWDLWDTSYASFQFSQLHLLFHHGLVTSSAVALASFSSATWWHLTSILFHVVQASCSGASLTPWNTVSWETVSVFILIFRQMIHQEWIVFVNMTCGLKFVFFTWKSKFSSIISWQDYFLLNCFCTFVSDQWMIHDWI